MRLFTQAVPSCSNDQIKGKESLSTSVDLKHSPIDRVKMVPIFSFGHEAKVM
jgi:hypothetical protein